MSFQRGLHKVGVSNCWDLHVDEIILFREPIPVRCEWDPCPFAERSSFACSSSSSLRKHRTDNLMRYENEVLFFRSEQRRANLSLGCEGDPCFSQKRGLACLSSSSLGKHRKVNLRYVNEVRVFRRNVLCCWLVIVGVFIVWIAGIRVVHGRFEFFGFTIVVIICVLREYTRVFLSDPATTIEISLNRKTTINRVSPTQI